jgi:hypothetical protein
MNEAQGAYGSAGGVASEDPSLIRAVRALNGRMWKLRITMSSRSWPIKAESGKRCGRTRRCCRELDHLIRVCAHVHSPRLRM